MGMGIRYDNTHAINTVLLVIFDTVHTVSIRDPGGEPRLARPQAPADAFNGELAAESGQRSRSVHASGQMKQSRDID
jgi:hypothetical protein